MEAEEPQQDKDDALQLQQQLRYYQIWARKLATAKPRPLSIAEILASQQLLVTGLPDGTTEFELENFINTQSAAHGAAVAPGAPVVSVTVTDGQALVLLRCSIEASNCLLFNGLRFNGAVLEVQRPRGYDSSAAVLLGPCQPNPAVVASVQRAAGHQALAPAEAEGKGEQHLHHSVTVRAIITRPDAAQSSRSSSSSGVGTFAAALRAGACDAQPSPKVAALPNSLQAAGALESSGSAAAVAAAASDALPHSSSCRTGTASGGAVHELLPAADQSKQDEVFIGGLPSHWKAQQVKELLAPYGQLKSLSVAMDAATGKNKGYAFVVFASSTMVSEAIDELDCKVVEGKILAVQRATDGKATGINHRESLTGGGDTVGARDGSCASCPQPQPPALQAQHRAAPWASSATNFTPGTTGPMHRGTDVAAAPGAGPDAPHPVPAAGPGAAVAARSCAAAAAAAAAAGIMLPHAAGAQAASSADSALTQRLVAAPASGGTSSHGMKQYDVNELYIGDLPLSWDEDAVRRLLGRYGKIKYFTLRSGRDKNFAFCKYKDSSVVDAAIQGLHGKIVDGYFLNVRRAIEGKQQHQLPPGRSSLDSRGLMDAGSRAAQQRSSLDPQPLQHPLQALSQQPQQQQLLHKAGQAPAPMAKGPPASVAGGAMGRIGAPSAAAAAVGAGVVVGGMLQAGSQRYGIQAAHPSMKNAPEPAILRQLHRQQLLAKSATASSRPIEEAAVADAGSGSVAHPPERQRKQLQQQDESVAAPLPPATPPACHQQQQQQGPTVTNTDMGLMKEQEHLDNRLPQTTVAIPAPPLQAGHATGFRQTSHLGAPQPPTQQHQLRPLQQHQVTLFGQPGPAGGWGAPGDVASSSNSSHDGDGSGNPSKPAQSQPQRQSLLQTWDMLSPWSLFSHHAH